MRSILALTLVVVGCGHNAIGPDDGGSKEGSAEDGGPLPDGSSPDGSNPDSGDGGNVKGNQGYTAGSRLKVQYYEGSDGSEQQNGFFDSSLNVSCFYITASDLTIRCLPISGQASSSAFSDSQCSQRLGYVTKGCTKPPYAYTATTNTACGGGAFYSVFPTNGAYTGTSVWYMSGTTCTAYTTQQVTSLYASYDAYSVGAEVAPSSFVSATTTVK